MVEMALPLLAGGTHLQRGPTKDGYPESETEPEQIHFSLYCFSFLPEHIHAKGEAFAHAKPVDCMESADRVCETLTTQ